MLLEIVTGEVDSDSADAADGTWASGRLEALMRSGDLALATLARAIAILCAEDQAERPQGCDAVLATLRPSLPGNDVPWPDFVERRWATKAPTETDNTEDPAERRVLIPWIATWTSESESTTWSRPFDESLDPMGAAVLDHELVDEANELWPAATRVVSELGGRQGVGQPIFNRLHPARQRRAMLEGRCSVCGTVLAAPWTFVGHVTDDGRTPAFREPPLCGVCLPQALAACPGLRAFLEAGKLSIVTVDGYMPVADLGETDDPTAPVEHLLAIPAENGWHLNLLTGRDVANGAR